MWTIVHPYHLSAP